MYNHNGDISSLPGTSFLVQVLGITKQGSGQCNLLIWKEFKAAPLVTKSGGGNEGGSLYMSEEVYSCWSTCLLHLFTSPFFSLYLEITTYF